MTIGELRLGRRLDDEARAVPIGQQLPVQALALDYVCSRYIMKI